MSNLILTEYPNYCVENIWKHPNIRNEDRNRLKNYCDAIVEGKIVVEYGMNSKYGRMYPISNDMLFCISMWNKIRSTLFANTEFDIDIINCHNCLLLGLVENMELPTENLRYYCENRERVFEDIYIDTQAIKLFNSDNDDNKTHTDIVKLLFTILLYGGTIKTWADEMKFDDTDYKMSDFVNVYIEELKLIAEVMIMKYPNIKNEVYVKEYNKEIKAIAYRNENKKDKRRKNEVFDTDKFKVSAFKTLAIILQDYERKIVLSVFDMLKPLGVVITSYNYDGFQVLKSSFDLDLIDKINEFINDKYKYIKFKVKPFREGLNMSLIPIAKPYINYDDFEYYEGVTGGKCEYFNKFIVMTTKPSVYNILDEKGNIINQLSSSKLCDTYAQYKLHDVLDGYITNCNKNTKENLVYMPPPLICRDCDYNSWRGFAIQDVKPIDINCDIIYEHILEMSGLSNTKDVYNYLLNWISWTLQYPAMKTGVCIILYSKEQGTGKSCLAENLFEVIMGKSKLFITGNIDKLFGRFADTGGKHIVVLNEASGKDTKGIHEIIKDAITRERQMVEKKGVDAYEIDDFANYILTTNNISCVDIRGEDRRFMPIQVGNSKLRNVGYFTRLRSSLDNPLIMRKFYDDMMKRDLTKWNAERDRPITDLKADIIATCVSPYEEFYGWLIDENRYRKEPFEIHKMNYKIKAMDFYKVFQLFWKEVGRHGLCPDNKKFGVEVKGINGIVFKHTKNGNMYYVKGNECLID
jgi:hypothetical protein